MPPPPRTNYANPKCFMGVTQDCGKKMTREHYVSEGILEEIGFIIRVNGVPWVPTAEGKRVARSKLTSRVLCDRHNSALSCLDSQGVAFFRAIKQYSDSAYDGRERVSAFNGRDIERWMLKTLYGLLASKSLQAKPGVRIDAEIDQRCVNLLFDKGTFVPGRGLFVRTDIGRIVARKRIIGVQAVTNNAKGTLNGICFNIMGFDFLLTTSRVSAEHSAFRPGYIVFSSRTGLKVIHLIWADPGPHRIVTFAN
jgi:hypothetical protein